MGSKNFYLLFILYKGRLMKVALEVEKSLLSEDCLNYHREPDSMKELHSFLPLHVRNCGPVVEVEHLVYIHVVKQGGK